MDISTWQPNLKNYISNIPELTPENVYNVILRDMTLKQGICDFLSTNHNQDIIVLYGDFMWNFDGLLTNTNVISSPLIEGTPTNQIEWKNISFTPDPERNIQLSYLMLNDIEDPLYEFKIIGEHYNIPYNLNKLVIKTIIDNRSSEFKNNSLLSIESRSNVKITSALTLS